MQKQILGVEYRVQKERKDYKLGCCVKKYIGKAQSTALDDMKGSWTSRSTDNNNLTDYSDKPWCCVDSDHLCVSQDTAPGRVCWKGTSNNYNRGEELPMWK